MKFNHTQTLSALAVAAAMLATPLAASAAPAAGAGQSSTPTATVHSQKTAFHWDQQRRWNRHARHGAHWAHALNLTQDQKDQIFKIRHDQAPAIYEQKKIVREAAKSLRDQGRADSFDASMAQQAADRLGQAQGKLALIRAETSSQIRAVLTPEQRTKLAQRHTKKMKAGSARS